MTHPILTHPRNNDIYYHPGSHTYWYQLETQFDGITKWIKSYSQPFDAKNISFAVARRDGRDQQDVLDEWDEKRDSAADYGNFVHDAIERWGNKQRRLKGQKEYVDVVKKLLKEKGLTLVAVEFVVFDEETGRASPIDILCVNKEGKLVVVDVKTFEKGVQWEGFKDARMRYPLYTLPDSNYYHASLQVGWYVKQLVERYGQQVETVGYILHIRKYDDEIKASLIQTDENAVEMINTLYKHEGDL